MLDFLLWPGGWLLDKLLIEVDTPTKFGVALYLSLCAWAVGLKCLYSALSRALGLFDPAVQRYFRWLYPWTIPYRYIRLPFRAWKAEFEDGSKDTAAWAGLWERMTLAFEPGLFIIGRLRILGVPVFQICALEVARHVVAYGLTGSNKTNTLIATLAYWNSSTICCDVGGGVTRALYHRQGHGAPGIIGKGHRSFTLDPSHLTGFESNCYDPILGDMREAVKCTRRRKREETAVKWAVKIAAGLIVTDHRETKKFFPDSARGFLVGLILFCFETNKKANLPMARDLLMNGLPVPEDAPDGLTPWTYLLFVMSEHTTKYGGIIAKCANAIQDGGRESSRDIISTARNATAWLDFPSVRWMMRKCDFTFARDFKDKDRPSHLTIVGSIGDFVDGSLSNWYLTMVATAVYAFETTPGKLPTPALLCADEAQNVPLDILAKAPAHLRKHSLACFFLAQDVTTMARAFPALESINGNTDFMLWFPTDNKDNLARLMEELSTRTVREKVEGGPFGDDKPHYRDVERPLAYRSQIRKFLDPKRNNLIVTRTGKRPLKLKAARYFLDLPLYYFAPDPDHRESFVRRQVRKILCRLIPGPLARKGKPVGRKASPLRPAVGKE